MKKITVIFIEILFVFVIFGCSSDENKSDEENLNYKQLMRTFVQNISSYSKTINTNFKIIPQNGIELSTTNGEISGSAAIDYLKAIDGVGQEDLFYGYDDDNQATPLATQSYLIAFLDSIKANGVEVLVTDYCWDYDKVDDSYERNFSRGYISFAAPERYLNVIPTYPNPIFHENNNDITDLSAAKNFLYLIDPSNYTGDKNAFLQDLQDTNYDVLIIDAFFFDSNGNMQWLNLNDINSLKTKKNGGKRLVFSFMSIGEAESYRYYWNHVWDADGDGHPDGGSPEWLADENPNWPGNYKVRYWYSEWQAIIYGNDSSYLKNILDNGFDGVYLDIIDAFEYFE